MGGCTAIELGAGLRGIGVAIPFTMGSGPFGARWELCGSLPVSIVVDGGVDGERFQ